MNGAGVIEFAMRPFAALIRLVERDVNGELVLGRYRASRVKREVHLGRIGEVERDAPTLDDAAVDVGPFGLQQSSPGYRTVEAVKGADATGLIHRFGQDEFARRRGAAAQAAGCQDHGGDKRQHEPAPEEAHWPWHLGTPTSPLPQQHLFASPQVDKATADSIFHARERQVARFRNAWRGCWITCHIIGSQRVEKLFFSRLRPARKS